MPSDSPVSGSEIPPTPETLVTVAQIVDTKATELERMAVEYRRGSYSSTDQGVELRAIHRAHADYCDRLASGLRWLAAHLPALVSSDEERAAWEDWATHQEWCRNCAEGSPSDCSEGGPLRNRAHELRAVRAPSPREQSNG